MIRYLAISLEGRHNILFDDLDSLVGVELLIEVCNLRREQAGHETILRKDESRVQTVELHCSSAFEANVSSAHDHCLQEYSNQNAGSKQLWKGLTGFVTGSACSVESGRIVASWVVKMHRLCGGCPTVKICTPESLVMDCGLLQSLVLYRVVSL